MVNRHNKTVERELEKGLKEVLLKMNKEEFSEYFRQLIEKYYKILFTFEEDYSKYYEDSNKQYDSTIQLVKDLLKYEYNNLDNYENLERLKQAENIAFNQMNTIHFLEESYSDLIYYNAVMEVNYINETLTALIGLYEKEPSEALLTVIEGRLTSTKDIIKQANKLPTNEGSIMDYEEKFTVKKEHFKADVRPSEDVKQVVFTVPIFSIYLKEILDKFYNILEDLKNILPEDVIEDYVFKLNYPEELERLDNMIALGMEREQAIETVALLIHLQKKNNTNGFLYEILESWS